MTEPAPADPPVTLDGTDLRFLLEHVDRHNHSVPGIWNHDNGNHAERRCAECAILTRLDRLLTPRPRRRYDRLPYLQDGETP